MHLQLLQQHHVLHHGFISSRVSFMILSSYGWARDSDMHKPQSHEGFLSQTAQTFMFKTCAPTFSQLGRITRKYAMKESAILLHPSSNQKTTVYLKTFHLHFQRQTLCGVTQCQSRLITLELFKMPGSRVRCFDSSQPIFFSTQFYMTLHFTVPQKWVLRSIYTNFKRGTPLPEEHQWSKLSVSTS